MSDFAGRHALVTGGGTGIGAAIARALAAAGAAVTLVGRRAGPVEALAGQLPKALGIAADVTQAVDVARAFDAARTAYGPVDILINNAGAADSGPFSRITSEGWRRTLGVNLDALYEVIQAGLPDLKSAVDGRIVTIASSAGLKGYAYSAAYVAAKHGAIGLTRALALEFAGTALTVNAVCPGFTDTEIVSRAVETIAARSGRTPAEAQAELTKFNPQGRLIEPQEVADAVLWLCLPQSRSVTGQAIVVAGGEVM